MGVAQSAEAHDSPDYSPEAPDAHDYSSDAPPTVDLLDVLDALTHGEQSAPRNAAPFTENPVFTLQTVSKSSVHLVPTATHSAHVTPSPARYLLQAAAIPVLSRGLLAAPKSPATTPLPNEYALHLTLVHVKAPVVDRTIDRT